MKNVIVALLAIVLFTSAIAGVEAKQAPRARLFGLENSFRAGPKFIELFDSFLDGFEVNSLVANSTECVHKTERGYADVFEAVYHILHRGWTWENYLDFLASIGNVTPITRTCFDVTVGAREQINTFFGNFDGFIDFTNQVRNGIVVNAWEWYTISSAMVSAIQNNRPKEVAFQAGRGLKLLFKFNPRLRTQNAAEFESFLPDLRPIEDFMTGFITGSRVFDSENIRNCVNETEFLVGSVEDANREFSRRTDAGFRAGVFEIADIFERLKPLNVWCYDGTNDVVRIVTNMYNTFNSPLDIVINAARNGPAISAAALGVWQAFRNGNWKTVGEQSGNIFFMVFKTG